MSKLQQWGIVALVVFVLCILNAEAVTWGAMAVGCAGGLYKLLDAMAEHGNL